VLESSIGDCTANQPQNKGTGATRSAGPLSGPSDSDAKSVCESARMTDEENGDAPDLDAARGLIPAIVIGAAVWAIAFAIIVLIWA